MSSVYNKTIFLLISLLIFFSFTNSVFAIVASQLDYSAVGNRDYSIDSYMQTLGHLSGADITSITVRVSANSTNGYNKNRMRFIECSDPNCYSASITKKYYSYTTSARTTETDQVYTVTSFDGPQTFSFAFGKEAVSNTNITSIPLDPTKYYAIWWTTSDGNTARLRGSTNDTYTSGICSRASGFSIYFGGPVLSNVFPCPVDAPYKVSDIFFYFNNGSDVNSGESPPFDGKSQIISFTPDNATTTSSTTVNFTYKVYINADDIGFFSGKQMIFDFQHQPIGIGTVLLDKVHATSSGYYTYTTTKVLDPGNYIVNACLETYYIGGIIGGLDFITNPCLYHQFVVGTSTFVGNLFQNGVTAIDNQVSNLTSTSSTAILGAYCNPFSGFDIIECTYALLIPSTSQLKDTMNKFYSDFLIRVPWGYGSVAVADLLGYGKVATTSLSASNLTFTLPNTGIFATATSTAVLKGKTMTFIDWSQMASSTVQNYWAPALTPLNNFLNIMMGASFIFWLVHFFKKLRP